jgi:hypothetical protein
LDRAFQLPSSPVVSCFSDSNFEFVEGDDGYVSGHRYVATVIGFEETGLRSQNPGSPLVVDDDGQVITPRWSTTCWGTDTSQELYGQGGAGLVVDGEGGVGGVQDLGVVAYDLTDMIVRGCDPLDSSVPAPSTSVSFAPSLTAEDIQCGSEAGEMVEFSATLLSEESPAQGGQGGASDESQARVSPCGEVLVWDNWPAGEYLQFELQGYDGATGEPGWTSACTVFTRAGVTTPARCDAFTAL